jgi:hypothetical protein
LHPNKDNAPQNLGKTITMKKEDKKYLIIFYFRYIIILTNTINTHVQKQTKTKKFKNFWTLRGAKNTFIKNKIQ